jgi:hypothetical protein
VYLSLHQDDPLFETKQDLIKSLRCHNSLVHLIFLGEGLPQDLVAMSRVLIADEWEVYLMQQMLEQRTGHCPEGETTESTSEASESAESKAEKTRTHPVHLEPISVRNELLSMSTLFSLLHARWKALVDSEPDYAKDELAYPEDDEPRRLARIYRRGQKHILKQAITATRTLLSVAELVLLKRSEASSSVTVSMELIDDIGIRIGSPYMSPAMAQFVAQVSHMAYQIDLDDEALLALIVMFECKRGEASHWYNQLKNIPTRKQERRDVFRYVSIDCDYF